MTEPQTSKLECPGKELSDAWRILGKLGHLDTIFNHISMAWRDNNGTLRVTMNPDGYLPSEVSPERMVTFPLDECDTLTAKAVGANQDGFELHSAIHRARMVPGVALHTHSPNAIAVGATTRGLLPLSQTAIEFVHEAIIFDYTGLFRNLTGNKELTEFSRLGGIAFLRNHGTLVVGEEIDEVVYIQHFLEEACKVQIATLSQNQQLILPSDDIVRNTAQSLRRDRRDEAKKFFMALRRTV